MFNKSKPPVSNGIPTSSPNGDAAGDSMRETDSSSSTLSKPSVMDALSTTASKPSILSEGFSFRGEIAAKGAIHVEGSLNGQIQVDELTIGSKGQVEGVVTCSSLHIKGKFSGTATCQELIVTSSASVDGHVVYQTLSVQKGASIKGELLLVK